MRISATLIFALIFAIFSGCGLADPNGQGGSEMEMYSYQLDPDWSSASVIHVVATSPTERFEKSYHPESKDAVTIELDWKLCHDSVMHVTLYYTDREKPFSTSKTFGVEKFDLESPMLYKMKPQKG